VDDALHKTIDRFTIGGEVLVAPTTEVLTEDSDAHEETAPSQNREAYHDIQVRVGTLLKTETVSFLLGAGASVCCGGQLIGSVPLAVERTLHNEGIKGTERPRVARWLTVFYLAVESVGDGNTHSATRSGILERWEALRAADADPIHANFEKILAVVYRWRAALPETGGRLRVDGLPSLDATAEDLDACLLHASRALARTCDLPTLERVDGLATFKTFVRKLLTRPLNLKRVNVFTLNYDTLVEQASDAEGVVLLDGFVGTQRRLFRPESYEQDLYFPAETTEGRVHRFDRVLHLYKLHGSITWTAHESTFDNPYGVQSATYEPDGRQPLLIYPTPAKFGETLGTPYSDLFRRFAGALARPQSVLFVIGYGFGDEHVNAIIRQALAIPSFTIVIVDPAPQNDFVTKLRAQHDRRVWIAEGSTLGTFTGFVNAILPDLRDEEIQKQVIATHRALANTQVQGDGPNGD